MVTLVSWILVGMASAIVVVGSIAIFSVFTYAAVRAALDKRNEQKNQSGI